MSIVCFETWDSLIPSVHLPSLSSILSRCRQTLFWRFLQRTRFVCKHFLGFVETPDHSSQFRPSDNGHQQKPSLALSNKLHNIRNNYFTRIFTNCATILSLYLAVAHHRKQFKLMSRNDDRCQHFSRIAYISFT